MAKQKRDNHYLLGRLRHEHPAVYADYRAGRYPSQRAAFIAAGLVTDPLPLTILRREWHKVDPAAQAEFLSWIGMAPPAATVPIGPVAVLGRSAVGRISAKTARAAPHYGATSVTNKDGYLTPQAHARIERIMTARQMRMGQVMSELSRAPLDASLARARRMNNPSRIRVDMAHALERWLAKYKHLW